MRIITLAIAAFVCLCALGCSSSTAKEQKMVQDWLQTHLDNVKILKWGPHMSNSEVRSRLKAGDPRAKIFEDVTFIRVKYRGKLLGTVRGPFNPGDGPEYDSVFMVLFGTVYPYWDQQPHGDDWKSHPLP